MAWLRAFDSIKLLEALNFWAIVLLALCVGLEAVAAKQKSGPGLGARFAALGRREWMLPVLLTLLAAAVRLFRLSVAPAGLNVDEASIAYDAWCMANFGTDRFGVANPAYLISWGSGQDVLYAWLLRPLYSLFGFSVFTTRLPQALAGTAAVPLLYLLLRKTGGRPAAFTGAALLCVSPWHVMASRWALVVYPLVGLLCAAAWFFLLAAQKPWAYLPAFACWALCLYAYLTSALFLLPFLALLFAYHSWMKKMNWKWFLGGAALGLALAFPIVWFVLCNNGLVPEIRTPVFSAVKLFIYRQNEVAGNLYGNGRLITDLLVWQQPAWQNSLYDHVRAYGIVFLFSTPFAVGGACGLCRRSFACLRERRYSAESLWLFWLAGAVFAALMIHPNTFNRCVPLVLCFVVLAAHGVAGALRRFKSLRAVVPALYLAAFALFLHSYFFTLPADMGRVYNHTLKEAYALADQVAGGREILAPQNVGFYGAQSTYPLVCLNRQLSPGAFMAGYNTARNPAYADSTHLQNVHFLAQPLEGVAPYGKDKVYVLDNLTDPVWDYEAAGFTIEVLANYTVAWMD